MKMDLRLTYRVDQRVDQRAVEEEMQGEEKHANPPFFRDSYELHPQHFLTNADIGKVYDVTFFNELHRRMEYEVMRFKGKQQIQQSERYIWGSAREDLPLVEILEFFASEH